MSTNCAFVMSEIYHGRNTLLGRHNRFLLLYRGRNISLNQVSAIPCIERIISPALKAVHDGHLSKEEQRVGGEPLDHHGQIKKSRLNLASFRHLETREWRGCENVGLKISEPLPSFISSGYLSVRSRQGLRSKSSRFMQYQRLLSFY